MADRVTFIEIEPEGSCCYCGRKKLSETDRFYKVFVGENDIDIVVCELCKGGFSTRILEGPERSYATHLIFFVRRSLLELQEKLPKRTFDELCSAIESYEDGEYLTSFRCIGLVAESLTNKLFSKRYGNLSDKDDLSWETKLGKMLSTSRSNKKNPEEAFINLLFSLKWFRNAASHPSEYQLTAADTRMGLTVITYMIQQIFAYNLI